MLMAEPDAEGYLTNKDWKPYNGQILVLKTDPMHICRRCPFGVAENVTANRQKFNIRLIRFDLIKYNDSFEFCGGLESIVLTRAVPNPMEGKMDPVCTEALECKYSRAKAHQGWKVKPYDEKQNQYLQECYVALYDPSRNHIV